MGGRQGGQVTIARPSSAKGGNSTPPGGSLSHLPWGSFSHFSWFLCTLTLYNCIQQVTPSPPSKDSKEPVNTLENEQITGFTVLATSYIEANTKRNMYGACECTSRWGE